jgi:flagellar hook-basal body complex protein FliE
MAIPAIAGSLASIPTTPTLPSTGQIGWTGGSSPTGPIPPGDTLDPSAVTGGTAASGAQSFGHTLTNALDSLQATQAKADTLAVQAATGDLTNVHDYMIAATEASLATELTVAVRNKAVDAFNQIMNMGV